MPKNTSKCRQLHKLPDGRCLEYTLHGSASAAINMVFHHGYPGSCVQTPFTDEQLKLYDTRVLTVSRPGTGRSSRLPGRHVKQWADDLNDLLAHLSISCHALVGYSFGAPYAMSAAHAAVTPKVVLLVSPFVSDGFNLKSGMSIAAWSGIWLVRKARPVASGLQWVTAALIRRKPSLATTILAAANSKEDRQLLRSRAELADLLSIDVAHAYAQGHLGGLDDIVGSLSDWTSDQPRQKTQIIVAYSRNDTTSPPLMARHVAQRLGAQLLQLSNGGHLSVFVEGEQLLALVDVVVRSQGSLP